MNEVNKARLDNAVLKVIRDTLAKEAKEIAERGDTISIFQDRATALEILNKKGGVSKKLKQLPDDADPNYPEEVQGLVDQFVKLVDDQTAGLIRKKNLDFTHFV